MRMPRQKHAGSSNEFALLDQRDAFGTVSESWIDAQTHLDEDQHVVVLHNQIQLAQPAPKIACDEFKSLALKMRQRYGFRPRTGSGAVTHVLGGRSWSCGALIRKPVRIQAVAERAVPV